MNAYEKYGATCLGSIRATKDDDYDRYGCSGGTYLEDGIMDVKEVVEKPGKEKAPSDLMNVSGFLFTPEIFDYLDDVLDKLGEGEELYYNDALKHMLSDGKRVLAVEIKGGKYYDTGNKLEYLKTVVEFALKHKDLNGEFKKYLASLNLK